MKSLGQGDNRGPLIGIGVTPEREPRVETDKLGGGPKEENGPQPVKAGAKDRGDAHQDGQKGGDGSDGAGINVAKFTERRTQNRKDNQPQEKASQTIGGELFDTEMMTYV